MNKSSSQNSALKTPLNDILGSKGHIMVLRELSRVEHPMSHSELLDRTDLSRQGVYDVVSRLEERGIVAYVGSGRQQQITLRLEYPLTTEIKELFSAEKRRVEDLIRHLREEIEELEWKPDSSWIFGKVVQGEDAYGDPIRIVILGGVKKVDEITDTYRKRLYEVGIEKKYDVTIDIVGITQADLEYRPEVKTGQIILLWGIDPSSLIGESGEGSRKTHQDFEKQSLADAKVWSTLLKKYPEIIQRTITYLNNKVHEVNSGEKKELLEWRNILESMSYQRLKKFLESDSERAVRLRQSLPFWQVLNENERAKMKELQSQKNSQSE